MSTAMVTDRETPARKLRTARISDRVGFYVLASIAVAMLAGSSAPTPLYAVYQAEWGFSAITTTVVFGIYAVAVLGGLLTVGSLSDHVGRRPVLIVAVLVQAATMVLFAFASGVPELIGARVVQGLATGAALGAVGAGMLDVDRARGAVANAVAPLSGTATGALGSGLFVEYLPAPSHLVYLSLAAVFVLQAAGVAAMAEPGSLRPGALASLRPTFAVPAHVRRPLLVAIPALVAAWSLAGFYGSLAPALIRQLSGSDSLLLGGLALFALAAGGATSVLLLAAGTMPPHRIMAAGTAVLFLGVAVTLIAVVYTLPITFFVGAAIAGAGLGPAFQGSLRTVVTQVEPHQRAGVLSVVFVVSYLAMGVPAVIGGVLVVDGGGLIPAAREYGLAVMALAATALVGLLVESRRSPSRTSPASGARQPCPDIAVEPC
jgi:MFS family permease